MQYWYVDLQGNKILIDESEWTYENFTLSEMSCKCGCGMVPAPLFMDKLQSMRDEVRFPFPVSSGARCPEYNNKVSSTGFDGPHTFSLASDVNLWGVRAYIFESLAYKHGMTGLGRSQKGDYASRFIHTDCILPGETHHPRPWIWSY